VTGFRKKYFRPSSRAVSNFRSPPVELPSTTQRAPRTGAVNPKKEESPTSAAEPRYSANPGSEGRLPTLSPTT
jgi:hypothetical protein